MTQLGNQIDTAEMAQSTRISDQFKFIQNIVNPQLKQIISANQRQKAFDQEQGIDKPDTAYNVVEEEFNNNT